ncbi:sulfite exporter TauE/SafE family protein [Martelella endophytica]|uniref:Probable membrane transporter protein n=1 Tax=Martelella endophytica TaxID=1486262 RepID=A0A0D5LN09_MAREN|nr:sulfite exporter TauE/SafE family protein [Martelella endophytica]AJY45157.1 hypothetical protein TM49_04745 [Martelella endophytica]
MSFFAEAFAAHSPASLALVAAFACVAGMARGFSGFGGAMIFMPLASLVIGPRVAAPLLMLVDFIGTLPTVPSAFRLGEKRKVLLMVAGASISVPAGAAMLARLDPLVVRWAISVIVVLLLLLLVSGARYRGRLTAPLLVGTGTVAGFFGGLAQIAGPPVVALWLGSDREHHIARANIMLFFTLSGIVSFLSYTAGGLLDLSVLPLVAIVEPAYLLGVIIGMRLFPLARPEVFRVVAYLLIAVAAITGLPATDALFGR